MVAPSGEIIQCEMLFSPYSLPVCTIPEMKRNRTIASPDIVRLVAGVDEAGRGPLAGPVVTAAVILDPARPIAGLADSKKLNAERREVLARLIKMEALAWALGRAEVEEIDNLNILQATLLAMRRAVDALNICPGHVQVDGNHCPRLRQSCEAIIRGDSRIDAISAASIIAKVARDHELIELDARYPGYGLASHKGYPTRSHIEALKALGVTPIHRRTFGPVRRLLDGSGAAE